MTTFPRSPRVRKGAIVSVDPLNPLASIVILQYNPSSLSRSLQGQSPAPGGAKGDAQRLTGPPTETIDLRAEIDAADQLEKADPVATELGIYPQLAALEMILYPKSERVIANALLARAGTLEVIPPKGPLTLFIWGVKRVVPVQISSFSIDEEAYDQDLNPIRATVSFGMRVLTYQDLPVTNPGYALYMAHQVAKEAMATVNSANNLTTTGVTI